MYFPKGVSSSLFHLACRFPFLLVPLIVGLLIISPKESSLPCLPEALITICFDDGYKSVFENAYPVLSRYGFVGTVFVIPSLVGKEGYMTWQDLTFLYENGWEIGSHSYSHPYLTRLSLEEIERELSLSKTILQDYGFEVFSFASPYGDWNETVIEIAKKYYFLHRTSWPYGLNEIPLQEDMRYYLKAVAGDEISPAEIKRWIDRAKAEKKWLILIFHRINENTRPYNITKEVLEEIVRYAYNQGFRGAGLAEFLTRPED